MAPSKRELNRQLDAANAENAELSARCDKAQRRAELALTVITKAPANLRRLFGPLTEYGPDESCTVLRYDAADGIAIVQLNPATGALQMSDPRREVDDMVVYFDTYGELGVREVMAVHRFRNDVKVSRMPEDVEPVYGSISLIASVPGDATSTNDGSTEPAHAGSDS
ncbi:hypothetical protein PV379_02100 [Streptomyces caniscabiei]|uniref:hypothetical protein n=1 Tax=Streptomyces caniscabiei TaxID=2746961 RepID=UPI0029A27790|nr:hypothetical protein [Streptomyces caniscabiei]MDX2776145.1 hypothetical protein [Streptomyces caniscabiei]